MLIHRRTPSLILPDDPSPEELLQFWTLSARDRAEVLRCRGDANRRRYAVQLCTLRAHRRFLPEASPAPVAMTNHLAQQLSLPLVLLEEVPGQLATETEQLQRIREYPGWRPFDDDARTRLTTWLTQRATDDLLPSALVARAEDILRAWQIVLPALSTLETLVVSVTVRLQDDPYTRIMTSLSPEMQQAMDDLLESPANDFATIRRGRLHRKKRDALELPPRILHLRRTIEGALPRVRIEDLLAQVDAWCHFTPAFHRPDAHRSRMAHGFTTVWPR